MESNHSSYDNVEKKTNIYNRNDDYQESQVKRRRSFEKKICASPSLILQDLNLPRNISLEKKLAYWLVYILLLLNFK